MIQAMLLLFWMTVLTGVIYPLTMTGIGHFLFPDKTSGSLVKNSKGEIIGSKFLAQNFEKPKYFISRPSAISYNAAGSGASNMGGTNKQLKEKVSERIEYIKKRYSITTEKIPADLLFASGSGLDPHISVEAAILQIDSISIARNFSNLQKEHLRALVNNSIEQRDFSFLGEPRINVLLLNLKLDEYIDGH
jgi:K+-transporting ATPase ATPase C chain